ncbi:MAG: hypothetical protein WBA57_11515 [Elainellaceae cyanobacterium]
MQWRVTATPNGTLRHHLFRVTYYLLCAIAVCAYATTTLSIFFIDQDAESDDDAIASTKSRQALQAEIKQKLPPCSLRFKL